MEAALLSIAQSNERISLDENETDDYDITESNLKSPDNQNNFREACIAFAEALNALALQYIDNNSDSTRKSTPSKSVGGSSVEPKTKRISAEWLLSLTSNLPSVKSKENMSALQLSLAILSACQQTNEDSMNASLFDVLGAGEKELELMFELAPHAAQIRTSITAEDLHLAAGSTQGDGMNNSLAHHHGGPTLMQKSPEEEIRETLVNDYYEAANFAAIAKAELENFKSRSKGVMASTHTVTRESDKQLTKTAKKAAKVAAEKLRLVREAGIMIDEQDAIRNHLLGGGVGGHLDTGLLEREMLYEQTGGLGMKFMNQQQIQDMQRDLLPEGTKQYYEKTGLPKGTEREYTETYEKVIVPLAVKDPAQLHERLAIKDVIPTAQMRKAFAGTDSLNPMQSAVYEMAFNSQENLLICAPTGAGKTNVAMLTVVAHFRDKGIIKGGGNVDPYAAYQHIGAELSEFTGGKKVIYIAPMKALAQEVVDKFSSKLKSLKIIVRELTGDMQLTRAEADSADVIVTTPEKWDVVTRKGGDGSLSQACGLLIIDEVHLLADERGAVIESVVARLHRLVESSQRQVRLVGLSATLPNYEDVADFLRVDKNKGLFYFGPEHRPVPLQQTFVGVTGKSKFEKVKQMDNVCYDTVVDSLKRGYQVMVFVHSRKGTGETCEALADIARKKNELESMFVTQGTERWGEAHSRYADKAAKSRNRELCNHFQNGMGIHHAGMLRNDRKLAEEMFAAGAIKVLCCTATLAWGINLPAHTVVIKGTDIYDAEKGTIIDLSILDVMQIFGRAGRPQYDTFGEATLITSHQALARYLGLIVRSVPIESTFIKQLADHLNAEVCGSTVCNINEASEWLTYTYLYVRMCRNPVAYGITLDQKEDDPMLRTRTFELVKDAAKLLDDRRMLRYDVESGNLAVTDLGRVASHFYLQNESVATFNEELKLNKFPTDADLMHLICCACEFENVRVRQEEMDEMTNLLQKACPLKFSTPLEEFSGKCCVLLQAFISKARVNSFTLISDTNYIATNAGRVARALFEMCLKNGHAAAAAKLLRITKSIDKRIWWFQSPLRQFDGEKIPENAFVSLESKRGMNKEGYGSMEDTLALLDMQANEVGQYIHSKKKGATVQRCVGMLPRLEMTCNVQPVTRGILRFQLHLVPAFEWSGKYHGGAEAFWLWVEDGENSRIYHHECIMFTRRTHPEPMDLELTIPAFDPLPPQYFVRIVSDSWVCCETVYPISFQHLLLPEATMPHTNLLDLTPLPKTALHDEKFESLYTKFDTFNPIQTQLFHVLYHTDCPVLLGAPTGSGKTIVAELALLRLKRTRPKAKCVYIAPLKSLARERLKEWKSRFASKPLNWKVLELSGDTNHDKRALNNADILVCTPEKWDLITRGWRGSTDEFDSIRPSAGKKFVKEVGLLIMDEIHLLGEERGAVLEAIVSRTRFISRQVREEGKKQSSENIKGGNEQDEELEMTRILGLSTALANPNDLADWMGIDVTSHTMKRNRGLYNFRASVRPIPMTVHIQEFPGRHYCPRMATMNKPCYAAIKEHSPRKPVIIFVASRRQTRLTAMDLISYAAGDENPTAFLGCNEAYIEGVAQTMSDEALRHTLTFGIGLHHAGLSSSDRETVEKLFLDGDIQVLVATATLAWGVNLPAHLVIVKGTEFFDGKTSRYIDYPVTDVLQMMGRAGRPQFDTQGIAVVMVAEGKKNFYKKFLYLPFPVESCLKERLCETINAEVAIGTIQSISDAIGYLDWTFYARRIKMNPSYYGAKSGNNDDVCAFYLQTIKDTMQQLEDHGCVTTDKYMGTIEEDLLVKPTILGKAASNFYLQHQTPLQMRTGIRTIRKNIMEQLNSSDAPDSLGNFDLPINITRSSTAHMLYVLSHVHEFDELPVRHNEEQLNKLLSDTLPWGADLYKFTRKRNQDKYESELEMFSDPHTKCFLLLQAHITRAKLPISDYINDTRSVIDQVPRLLAAMQYISLDDNISGGSFELFCLFSKVRQVLEAKIMIDESPLNQIPGLSIDGSSKLTRLSGIRAIKELRQLPRSETFKIVREAFQGRRKKGGISFLDNALDFIYGIPVVTIENLIVRNEIEKSTGKTIGLISFDLVIERATKMRLRNKAKRVQRMEKEPSSSLVVALGTPIGRNLLCFKSIGIGNSMGYTRKEVKMNFDWSMANAAGGSDGGKMILRLLHENVMGMDFEQAVPFS